MADEDRRTTEVGGRRASDPPGVPLREHLETIIRGIATRVELEISGLTEKFERLEREIHKMRGELAALIAAEQLRQGQRQAHQETRLWVQWTPTVVAVLIAGYVAFFA